MSIEAKHAYRFGFLKSEKWQTVRLQRLVRDGAKCRFCGIRSLQNDVHHWKYPDNWWDTNVWHLKTLCRVCHMKVHAIMTVHPDWDWQQIKKKMKINQRIQYVLIGFRLLLLRLIFVTAWVINFRLRKDASNYELVVGVPWVDPYWVRKNRLTAP